MERTCRVSFVDAKGTSHTCDAVGQSVYEATLVGLRRISEQWGEVPGPFTPIVVSVPVDQTVTLSQIRAWVESHPRSPRETAQKSRLKELLPA